MDQTILTNFIKLTNPDKVVDKAIWINPQQIACLQTDTSPGGNPKILSLQRPDGGIQQVQTHNNQESFDLDIYCDFVRGNKTPDGQAMADIYETLPPWQKEDISSSYEFIAAAGQSNDTTMADDLSNLTDQAAAEMNSDDFASDDSKGGLTEDNIPF